MWQCCLLACPISHCYYNHHNGHIVAHENEAKFLHLPITSNVFLLLYISYFFDLKHTIKVPSSHHLMHSNLPPLLMATYIKSVHLSWNVILLTIVLYISFFGYVCEARLYRGKGAFVRTKGSNFVINGSPFLFNGFNAYWMMNVATDPSQRYKVSQVLQDAANAGLSVCRTWAFADGGGDNALQISPGVYNELVFQGLDFVVAEARKYGIRLILSFVNNYKDFGGRPQYVEWARNKGVQISSDDDNFYTNPVVKGYYKKHVQRVIARINTITNIAYSQDPVIMAWELINEPRCQVDYSGRTVNDWAREMALFVKSLDRYHLLEIGMEGFYGDTMPERKQVNPGYQVGTDFISNNLIGEIDFATIHAYPDQWLSGKDEDSQMTFMQRWMWSHFKDSRTILKKPLVIAEFGKSSKDPDYSIYKRDSYMKAVYRNIYMEARSGGTIGGGLVWQLMADGMGSYDDGYDIILSENPSTEHIMSQQSRAMTTLSHLLRLRRHHHHASDGEIEFDHIGGRSLVALAHHPRSLSS